MMKATSPTLPSRWMLAVLLAAVAACYVHGMYTDYLFDDASLILQNDAVSTIEGLPGLIGLGSKPGIPQHRALRNLSYALDHMVWGRDLRGYHITNITIHLFNAMLVLGIAWQLFADKRFALAGALLWAVHPVHTESVTYLSGRRDVLAGLFYLWVMYLYVTWRAGLGGRPRLFAAALLYVLGCFAKEHVVTVPGVIVLYEVVLAIRARSSGEGGLAGHLWRAAIAQMKRAPVFYAVIAVFPIAFTLYVVKFHPYNIGGKGYITPPLPTDKLSVAKYGVHYLKQLVFPRDLSLDYFPESLAPSSGPMEPATLAALALHAALAVLTVVAIRRGSIAGFGAAWFVITFLPMSNLVIRSNEPVAEHYLYLPSVGFSFAVVSGLASLIRRRPRTAPIAAAAVALAVLALGVRTDLRNREWEDPERVFRASLEVFPRSSRLWNNLGCFYLGRQRWEEALVAVDRAIELAPREAIAWYNRGFALRKLGRLADARKSYEIAMLVPHYLEPRIGLAFCLIQMKEFAQAAKLYTQILELTRDERTRWYYYHWRAVAHRELGDHVKARADFQEALRHGQRHPETLWQMALLLKKMALAEQGERRAGLFAQAEKLLLEAREHAADSAVLAHALGDLYQTMGENEKALAAFEAMATANEEYAAESALASARLLLAMGDRSRAKTAYDKARALQFSDAALDRALSAPSSSPSSR